MEFTYRAYKKLVESLRDNGYTFADYHNYGHYEKPVIMRHDLDNSLDKAVAMARFEKEECNIVSTYFVLLSTDFYNPASAASTAKLHEIAGYGHHVGLYFDETKYTGQDMVKTVLNEKEALEKILGMEICTVSMHRPSKEFLDSDLQIPGMINSYGKEFFDGFKYLSDSRHRWREDVEGIVKSQEYHRLHILTHPFWYNEEEKTIEESVSEFIMAANGERYDSMSENITDLDTIMKPIKD